METKVAVLIVYNHRYDKNIPILDKLYEGKFSHIFHLVPFYDGNKENVIPVYDSSYYFQNYIAQTYTHIRNKGFTHFLIVADDMVLNPKVNEINLWEQTGLSHDDCYISRLSILQERPTFWDHTFDALNYRIKQPGVDVQNILPSKEDAEKAFAKFEIPISKIPFKRLIPNRLSVFFYYLYKKKPATLKLDYPLIGGYSDIFIVTSHEMPKFCQYCGAFAATKLFVEIAIPTAMFLTAKTIKIDKDVKLKRGDVWNNEITELEEKYNRSLEKLLIGYPEDKLFLHPIKMSRWCF